MSWHRVRTGCVAASLVALVFLPMTVQAGSLDFAVSYQASDLDQRAEALVSIAAWSPMAAPAGGPSFGFSYQTSDLDERSEPFVPVSAWARATTTSTLAQMPGGAWRKHLQESDMGELRGGFRGITFSAFMTIENLNGDLTGTLDPLAPPPNFAVNNDEVQIQTVVGNFVGTHGIFQIAQVPGDYNIVNNNLFVQIFVNDLLSLAPAPSSLVGVALP